MGVRQVSKGGREKMAQEQLVESQVAKKVQDAAAATGTRTKKNKAKTETRGKGDVLQTLALQAEADGLSVRCHASCGSGLQVKHGQASAAHGHGRHAGQR